MKTIVWFGNSGSKHGDFGIPNLRIALPGLAAAAQRAPLKLLVVSNDEAKFQAVTADFPFPCEFRVWSRANALRDIAGADLCVVPNSRDRFSLAKSSNRLVLALSLGVPVVATSVPSAEPLRPFVIFDDWETGVETYLLDQARASADVTAAQAFIARTYAPGQIAKQWEALLSTGAQEPTRTAVSVVMAFIEASDDVDEYFELLKMVGARGAQHIVPGVTTDFIASRPELMLQLEARGRQLRLLNRRTVLQGKMDLDGVRAIVTMGRQPLKVSRAMIHAAEKRGVSTFRYDDLIQRPELRACIVQN